MMSMVMSAESPLTSSPSSSITTEKHLPSPHPELPTNVIVSPKTINPAKSGSKTAKVYCICRQPDGDRCPMVMCDWCKEWFHHDCIGLSADDIERIEEVGDEWLCQYCSGREPRPTSGPFSLPPRPRRSSATRLTASGLSQTSSQLQSPFVQPGTTSGADMSSSPSTTSTISLTPSTVRTTRSRAHLSITPSTSTISADVSVTRKRRPSDSCDAAPHRSSPASSLGLPLQRSPSPVASHVSPITSGSHTSQKGSRNNSNTEVPDGRSMSRSTIRKPTSRSSSVNSTPVPSTPNSPTGLMSTSHQSKRTVLTCKRPGCDRPFTTGVQYGWCCSPQCQAQAQIPTRFVGQCYSSLAAARQAEQSVLAIERNPRGKIADLLTKGLESFLSTKPSQAEIAVHDQLEMDATNEGKLFDVTNVNKLYTTQEVSLLGKELESALYEKHAPAPEEIAVDPTDPALPYDVADPIIKVRTKPLVGTPAETAYRQHARVIMAKLKSDKSDALRTKLRAGVWTPQDVMNADPVEFSFDTARDYLAARAKTLANSIRASRDEDVLVRKTHKGDFEVHRASVGGLDDDRDIQLVRSIGGNRPEEEEGISSNGTLSHATSRKSINASSLSSNGDHNSDSSRVPSRSTSTTDTLSFRSSSLSLSALAKGPMVVAEDAATKSRSEPVFRLPSMLDDVNALVHGSASLATISSHGTEASRETSISLTNLAMGNITTIDSDTPSLKENDITSGEMNSETAPTSVVTGSGTSTPPARDDSLLLDDDDDTDAMNSNNDTNVAEASSNGPSVISPSSANDTKVKFQDAFLSMLKDNDENVENDVNFSPAPSPSPSPEPTDPEPDNDSSIIWSGHIMHAPENGRKLSTRFIQIGGSPLTSPGNPASPRDALLELYLTNMMVLDGRLSKGRADEYLNSLHRVTSCELFLFELLPNPHDNAIVAGANRHAFDELFRQLHSTRKYAVLQREDKGRRPPEGVRFKDLYLAPLRPIDPLPAWLTHCPNTFPTVRSNNVILGVLVGSTKHVSHHLLNSHSRRSSSSSISATLGSPKPGNAQHLPPQKITEPTWSTGSGSGTPAAPALSPSSTSGVDPWVDDFYSSSSISSSVSQPTSASTTISPSTTTTNPGQLPFTTSSSPNQYSGFCNGPLSFMPTPPAQFGMQAPIVPPMQEPSPAIIAQLPEIFKQMFPHLPPLDLSQQPPFELVQLLLARINNPNQMHVTNTGIGSSPVPMVPLPLHMSSPSHQHSPHQHQFPPWGGHSSQQPPSHPDMAWHQYPPQ